MFQFYCDTTPIFGSIDFLKDKIGIANVRRAVRIGACNRYHMCGHNLVHKKSPEILKSLYKSAAFTVQAISYLQTGTYRKKKLSCCRFCISRNVKSLKLRLNWQQPNLAQDVSDRLSGQLFRWASRLIAEYRPEKTEEQQNA